MRTATFNCTNRIIFNILTQNLNPYFDTESKLPTNNTGNYIAETTPKKFNKQTHGN
jgi:hypothetical protein